MAVLRNGTVLLCIPSRPHSHTKPGIDLLLGPNICRRVSSLNAKLPNVSKPSAASRIKCFQREDSESDEAGSFMVQPEGEDADVVLPSLPEGKGTVGTGRPFLATLVILLGVALGLTLLSIVSRQPANQGSFLGIQRLADGSSSSAALTTPHTVGFCFKAFGYRFLLPEYAPGWVYFWLLMAAGCGLFISEEALNIWVSITLSRMLSLNGSWQSFVDSFSRNAPYIVSTVMWVYWGVCISDMIPFYLGKLFRQSGASDDVCSKLGIGKEKAMSITRMVQRYGNLVGFVERFSLGVRNPTAFLAGAMGISPEYFFAGVCFGGLVTLPIQLGIGFIMRERPVFALATVATAVGAWTVFPYAAAALTAFFLYLRRRYS